MSLFWDWFWNILALIAILVICTPTLLIKKWFETRQPYQTILPNDVARVARHKMEVSPRVQEEIIQAYNDAAYLMNVPISKQRTSPQVLIETQDGVSYVLFQADKFVGVVKTKGRKQWAYQLVSESLLALLQHPEVATE